LEETPFTIVDTKALLDEMMSKVREEEIALSVKGGSNYRSFRKKNCLIQIATRSEVFLVDTIELKEDVKVLSELFHNSGVLKVAHTKDAFLREFQMNLGMYVVNMFCLPIADRILSNKKKEEGTKRWNNTRSLKVLMKEFCDVEYSKDLVELEDWHERPLSDEYVKSARLSVQYLLLIYDKFRNKLIDQNLLQQVYQECNKVCSTVWQPTERSERSLRLRSHLMLYKRLGEGWDYRRDKQLNKVQIEVLRVLFNWRYTTAEKHDEGLLYLLKDVALYNIAKALPKDVEGIKECLTPDTPCSLLEENLGNICELIAKTVEEVSGAPDAEEKVNFFEKKHDVGNKRKPYTVVEKKGYQQKVQTYIKKIRQEQPSRGHHFGVRGGPHYGQPRYPMNPMMGYAMGLVRPRMGFRGPRGRGMRGMHMPPGSFSW